MLNELLLSDAFIHHSKESSRSFEPIVELSGIRIDIKMRRAPGSSAPLSVLKHQAAVDAIKCVKNQNGDISVGAYYKTYYRTVGIIS